MRLLTLIAVLILLTSCSSNEETTTAASSKKCTSCPSKQDVEMARCICKRQQSELRVVRRDGPSGIEFVCMDGKAWKHQDSDYSEGCTSL